jgi:ring-1,2-phenylacetyl-CoA epoxidase subunit PaaE
MASLTALEVIGLVTETPDAFTIQFRTPEGTEWSYQPGQYLVLQAEVAGERLRRAFSLSTAPGLDSHLAVTIKCIPDGRVSHYLRESLRVGSTVQVFPPSGKFTLHVDPARARHVVLVGGGSGITPLMSQLRSVLAHEPKSHVTLIYGNRDLDATIFRHRLEQLEEQHADRFTLVHVLERPPVGWRGPTGYISGGTARTLISEAKARTPLPVDFYLCGPSPMMEAVKAALADSNVPAEAIHTEYYTAPVSAEDDAAVEDEEEYEIVTQDVRVRLDGAERLVNVPPEKSILHAAIAAGMDPPFACEEGVCCTCRAKLISGLVQMNEREGLSDEEIEAGFILTCQSHPLTADVAVEFG